MNESTARAERFERDSPVLPVYTWAVPEKPVAVRIPFALIEKLEREAVESYRSLTSRGSEIGGLLFGSVVPGSPATVNVASYEAVPCEYATGPLYHLSPAEAERVEDMIEQRRAAGLLPVGLFRSHTRKGLSLDGSDLSLLDEYFTGPHDIALVIRPSATKPSTAGIFIREGGNIRSEASYLEFPFHHASQEPAKPSGTPEGEVDGPKTAPPAPAPTTARPAARAQIVPIASRREISPIPPIPVAAPSAPEPAASKPEPAPAAAAPAVKTPAATPAPSAPKAPATPPPAAAPAPAAKPAATAPAPRPAAPVAEPKLPAASEPVAKKQPEKTEVAPETAAPRKSGKLLWIAIGAAVPVLLIGGFFVTSGILHLHKPTVPAVATDSGLALRVERNAGDILLTWNRDADAIKRATRAVLSISDGTQHENVEMDLSQLRTGSIVYTPVTADVVFSMEVTATGQNQPVSETVRVLRTRPSPMPDQPQSAAAQPQPGAKPGAPTATPAPAAGSPAQPPSPAPAEEEKVALAQPVKPFHAESLAGRLRPTRPADIPDSPVPVASVGVPKTPDVNLGGIVGAPVAPPPAPPKVSAPSAPKSLSTGGRIQQAELIRRRDPEYPKLARESGASGTVELTATVGVDGHVKAVKVVRGHPLLRQAAVDAVKQWIYRPTILNGTPVETETQIILNFKNER